MPSLLSLPNELLTLIVKYAAPYDREDLMAFLDWVKLSKLCLVSKAFCFIVQPLLYARYEQPLRSPPRLFLRTLLDRPDLAAYVETLSIYDWEREPEEQSFRWYRWKRSKDEEIVKRASKLEDPNVKGSYGVPEFVLLLSLTINLVTLDYTILENERALAPAVQRACMIAAETKQPFLPRLRTVLFDHEVRESSTELGFSLAVVEPLLRLNSGYFLGHYIDNGPGVDLPFTETSTLNLEYVDLRCSFFSTASIVSLIRACKSLKRFFFRASHRRRGNEWFDVNFDTISAAFMQHKETLEYLSFDLDGMRLTKFCPRRFGHFDLHDMKKLHSLELPAWALVHEQEQVPSEEELRREFGELGEPRDRKIYTYPRWFSDGQARETDEGQTSTLYMVTGSPPPIESFNFVPASDDENEPEMTDLLPPSLETLIIRAYHDAIGEHLQRVSECYTTKFPALQHVSLTYNEWPILKDLKHVKRARETFDQTGISFFCLGPKDNTQGEDLCGMLRCPHCRGEPSVVNPPKGYKC